MKLINKIIPKEKNSIFVEPLNNCEIDKYDIINYMSDTALSLINYWIEHPLFEHCKVFLVIHHPERIDLYKQYTEKCKNLDFKFVTYSDKRGGLKKRILFFFVLFRCKLWVLEGPWQIRPYAVKSQHQVVLSYFASCKSNYTYDPSSSVAYRKFCTPERVTVISTSHFDSMAKSAAFGVRMQCFLRLGLVRNDYLYSNIHDDKILEWLATIKRNDSTKVVLYAPTFRDYDSVESGHNRSIWGFGYDDDQIDCFLTEKNIVVIAKLHPLQTKNVIASANKSVVLYEANFEYSFYELMKFADVFITDYSSIGYDWLLMDKPIIYNLWDLEKYRKERGLAYEPYEQVCAGEVVTNTDELISAMNTALCEDIYADKRRRIKDLMFTVQDFSSAQKVTDLIETYLDM